MNPISSNINPFSKLKSITHRITNIIMSARILVVFAVNQRIAVASAINLVDDINLGTHFE